MGGSNWSTIRPRLEFGQTYRILPSREMDSSIIHSAINVCSHVSHQLFPDYGRSHSNRSIAIGSAAACLKVSGSSDQA